MHSQNLTPAQYRTHATRMMKCAENSLTAEERAEYLKLAKAWVALAEGAEDGFEQAGEEPEAA